MEKITLACRAIFVLLAVQAVILAINGVALVIVDYNASLFIATYDIVHDDIVIGGKIVQTNAPWDIEKVCLITQFFLLFGITFFLMRWLGYSRRLHSLIGLGLLGILFVGASLAAFVESSKLGLTLIVALLSLSLLSCFYVAVQAKLGAFLTTKTAYAVVLATILAFFPLAAYLMMLTALFWGLSVATH